MDITVTGNLDYHCGFASGLMYALAQCNNGEPIMGPITIPTLPGDLCDFDPEAFKKAMEWINEEAGIAGYIINETDGLYGKWYELYIATTENEKPLPDNWPEDYRKA